MRNAVNRVKATNHLRLLYIVYYEQSTSMLGEKMRILILILLTVFAYSEEEAIPGLQAFENEFQARELKLRTDRTDKFINYVSHLNLDKIPLIKDPRQSQADEAFQIKEFNSWSYDYQNGKMKGQLASKFMEWPSGGTVNPLQLVYVKYHGKLPNFTYESDISKSDDTKKRQKMKIIKADGTVIEE